MIIIDEIGREEEAKAARTINERGVQLVGTAHGNTLDNLLLNPTLSDLVGGIESVTLSDDEARRRGTQKTVLERRSPPTFDVVVEIKERERLVVHRDVTKAVDGMLYGKPEAVQLRYRDENGKLNVEEQVVKELPPALSGRRGGGASGSSRLIHEVRGRNGASTGRGEADRSAPRGGNLVRPGARSNAGNARRPLNIITSDSDGGAKTKIKVLKVHAYGVARNRIHQAGRNLNLNIVLVDEVKDADVLVTLKSYYRRRRRQISDAEAYQIPVYVLRAKLADTN